MRSIDLQRRRLLRAAAGAGAFGAAPFALNLAAIGAASAQSAEDYRALVCVFLLGGNDQSNTIVPYDAASYAGYQSARPTLALARDALAPTVIAPTGGLGGREIALNPALAPLKAHFDAGRLAVVANVGPLRYPLTRAQYTAQTVPAPPQLFSHADHQALWQIGAADGAVRSGWGGRIGDLLASQNTGTLSICTSIAGNNMFEAGEQVVQLQMGTEGTVPIYGTSWPYGNNVAGQQLTALLAQNRTNLLEQQWNAVAKRAMDTDRLMRTTLQAAPALTTPFNADSPLAKQMKMVARLIQIRQSLGYKRQIFFVALGGWDMHENLVENHPVQLATVADALASFYAATVELGVADKVTTFTASEFGRGLQSNGRGSDHGWGSHHFVLGGAVRGKAVYGNFPTVALNGPEDAGQGRLIPTTSVDEYAATLAKWMGVSGANLTTVVPNIGRFAHPDLGFLNA